MQNYAHFHIFDHLHGLSFNRQQKIIELVVEQPFHKTKRNDDKIITTMVVSFCENDNEDPMISTICQSFYLSKSASVIATCAGALFSILPLIVISVIFRSQQRFSSIYHRIIIFISSFDFLTCISSALTTIPMPSSRGSGGDDVVIYPFDSIVGGAHGTVQTCEAQAFIYVFTFYGSGLYFCGLSVFYLCMIRFQMSDTTMRKCVEPIIHVFGCVLPLLMSVSLLLFWNVVYKDENKQPKEFCEERKKPPFF